MVVFSIDYRLVTPTIAGVPMQIQDVKLATWWAKAHAATYGASPTRVGLFGPSAGAGLAVLAGQQMNVQSAGAVKVVTSLSGFMDFSALIPPGTIGQTQMAEYLGCLGTPCKLAVEQAGSPQYNVHPGCPAAHILHSASEHLPLVQAQNLVKAMKAAGCKTQLDGRPRGPPRHEVLADREGRHHELLRREPLTRRGRRARIRSLRGRSSVGRALASQARCRGFESHRPLPES